MNLDRRSFLKVTGGAAALLAAGPAVVRPRPSEAQDPNTLVAAWDSDIDTLDPSALKSNGGYVTIANSCDGPIGWKVRPIEGRPGFFRSRPGEFDGMLAESWKEADDGATLVLRVRRGVKFPSGRRSEERRVGKACACR